MAAFDPRDIKPNAPLRFGSLSPTGCDYFDYAPGQPNLHLMMGLKQVLTAEHGIEQGFAAYRQTIPRLRGTKLALRRLGSLYDYSKAEGLQHGEVSPAGEPFVIPPPKVIGPGNHRPLTGTTRTFHVSCLADARVRGRSSIIEAADIALLDYQGSELDSIDDQVEFDAAVFCRHDKQIWTIRFDREEATTLDSGFSLLGARTDFFGDWIAEYVLKYVASSLSGILPRVPILIDANMPKTHRQALEMMGASDIIEVPAFATVRVRRLWCGASLSYMPLHQLVNDRFKWDYLMGSPQRFQPIQREISRRAEACLEPASGPSRVFLARRDFRHRKLVNKAEIEDIARAYDFVIAFPEDLDFSGQVRLVRGARYILGPEGSAFFLTYFLDHGTRVCILNHPLTEALAGYNGNRAIKELTVVSGPTVRQHHENPQDADYTIDPKIFSQFLDEWTGCPGDRPV
jgi:capsular polysaccharide biosynthesis protein